jgi:hypothetical protein
MKGELLLQPFIRRPHAAHPLTAHSRSLGGFLQIRGGGPVGPGAWAPRFPMTLDGLTVGSWAPKKGLSLTVQGRRSTLNYVAELCSH